MSRPHPGVSRSLWSLFPRCSYVLAKDPPTENSLTGEGLGGVEGGWGGWMGDDFGLEFMGVPTFFWGQTCVGRIPVCGLFVRVCLKVCFLGSRYLDLLS